ncbi:hypothetical protein BB561_000225 [Smittium simulii]|uniref:CCHC-type domain-containing protein n=1 Tax=Smittium simulii TaxID=133385 RepID=A0A2T9Z028_9FUNG|nr:hypothetical protein BB561_000225 [Smittium simulii]
MAIDTVIPIRRGGFSTVEKDCRRNLGLCLYCGQPAHIAIDCLNKSKSKKSQHNPTINWTTSTLKFKSQYCSANCNPILVPVNATFAYTSEEEKTNTPTLAEDTEEYYSAKKESLPINQSVVVPLADNKIKTLHGTQELLKSVLAHSIAQYKKFADPRHTTNTFSDGLIEPPQPDIIEGGLELKVNQVLDSKLKY